MTKAEKILELSHLRSTHIAQAVGCSARYARRVLERHGLSHPHGPPTGADNPAWRGGRMVDLDGYVLTQTRPTRILEHREVMAAHIGRHLKRGEVVDHIDGITIHNDPTNLRLFASNAEHLRETTTGQTHHISARGRRSIAACHRGEDHEPVDTYRLRKERGDVRLRAILRAAIELGTKHPCLCGVLHWLEQTGIDPQSRRSLKRAWGELLRRYEADLAR